MFLFTRRVGWLLAAGLLLACAGVGWAQCLPAAGCQPGNAPPSTLGFGILRVRLANVDTITRGASDGYQDYSCRRAVRLDRGTTYTLQVATGPNVDERVRAWIDFDQDGSFNLTTELVLNSVGRQHAGSFTVPATLLVGAALRLRVAADYVNAPAPGACTTPQYSQTEDYRVVVTPASLPRPVVQFSAADSVSCSGVVALRDRSRNAPVNWRWDFGDGTGSTQQHPTHTYATPGTYTVKLRACNASGCDSLTRVAFAAVRADGPRPAPCQPATVAYCCNFGLARVQLAGLDHQPGGGAAGYQDASCANRAALRADWPDTLRLTTGGASAHDVRVYLDLDNDGQFSSATELLYQGLAVTNPVIPLRISSQRPGLVLGQTLRLRIWADYAGSPAAGPCAAPQWGQVVDYGLTVVPNTAVPQARFDLTYTQLCGPVQVSVVNTSRGQTSASWDFGDGSSSTAPTPPPHTYTTPGLYELRLVVANAAGRDTLRRTVAVAANCPGYCTPGGNGGSLEGAAYFTRVKLHTLDNAVYRPPGVGYRDYTALYTELQQGQPYQLRTESPAWSFAGPGPWARVTAWLDYNQNGVFEAREQLGPFVQFSPVLASLTVPLGAQPGATRLRVQIADRNYVWLAASCPIDGAYHTVTTEDYTVVIVPAAAPPQAGFTVDLNPSCTGLVQLRDTSLAAPTAWYWLFGDGGSSTQQHPQHTYASPGAYNVSLVVTNRYGVSLAGRAGYVTVAASASAGAAPRPAACLPPAGPMSFGGIASFTLGSALTYTGSSGTPGYRDETCAVPPLQLQRGLSYPVSMLGIGSFIVSHSFIWLDANDDGYFDPVGELVFSSLGQYEYLNPKQGTLTVPATAVLGRPLRLRVAYDGEAPPQVPGPCYRQPLGQVRDFTVVVSTVAAVRAGVVSAVRIYPNPAPGREVSVVTPQLAGQAATVRLFDSVGRLVLTRSLRLDGTGSAQLPLPDLPAGLYLLRLNDEPASQRLHLL